MWVWFDAVWTHCVYHLCALKRVWLGVRLLKHCFCCSDGLSRTGAFCALYSVLERVKTEQIVDVFQAIKTLRIQRTGLLGTIVSQSVSQSGGLCGCQCLWLWHRIP